jgi:hypothetical protein
MGVQYEFRKKEDNENNNGNKDLPECNLFQK